MHERHDMTELEQISSDLQELAEEVGELQDDLSELRSEVSVRGRMKKILDEIAVILRGPPPEGMMYDWSSLPDRVRELKTKAAR